MSWYREGLSAAAGVSVALKWLCAYTVNVKVSKSILFCGLIDA